MDPTSAGVVETAKKFDWKRNAPLVAMVGLAAYFDWLLRGQAGFTLGILMLGLAPLVLRPITGPVLARIGEATGIPVKYRRTLAVGVPVAFLYIFRWSGTQGTFSALLTMAIPIGTALYIAKNRTALEARLKPWFKWRDRTIPDNIRLVLVVVVPILIAFLFIHGSLIDLIAFFGGSTRSRTMVAQRGWQILFGTFLSTVSVFLLAHKPGARE